MALVKELLKSNRDCEKFLYIRQLLTDRIFAALGPLFFFLELKITPLSILYEEAVFFFEVRTNTGKA